MVFYGNSITDAWARYFDTLFQGKPYVGRGISGQTTPQMLVRFRQDVISLHPAAVVILAGTNDIAGNTGPSTQEMIEDNLRSMVELAHANGIQVVLSSVLPASDYPWRPGLDPGPKIVSLDSSLTADAGTLVPILARGLRRFHETPVERCPFDFRLGTALAHVHLRLHGGKIQPERDFHGEFAHLSADEAVARLERTRPPSEEVVACHGDYCLPNVLIEGGAATGFVDLGELGVADRWWDLAVGSWSVTWNLGPGYEELFLKEYGVEPDPPRLEFFRLLYDVVS